MKGGNVKEYYKVIKEKIAPFEGMVYYEGESEARIAQLEQKWGIKIRPIFREFLLHFGFTQDLLEELRLTDDNLMEKDIDFLRHIKVDGFLPITTGFDEDYNTFTIAIYNDDTKDDTIYHIINDSKEEKLEEIKKTKQTFAGLINKSVRELRAGERSDNEDKMLFVDFTIYNFDLSDVTKAFKAANMKQLTAWKYPQGSMGDAVAEFEVFESDRITLQRIDISEKYNIEISESVSDVKQNEAQSLIKRMENLLITSDLKYEIEKDIIDV